MFLVRQASYCTSLSFTICFCRVTAVKEFEEYFFDQRPRISSEWIRILFQGEDGISGLIATCGNVSYSQVRPVSRRFYSKSNHPPTIPDSMLVPKCFRLFSHLCFHQVASRAALDLLCRLLDVEKNKDAQSFLDAFTHSDKQSLKSLQLHLHILSDRGNRAGAFRLVSILREKIPALPVEVRTRRFHTRVF